MRNKVVGLCAAAVIILAGVMLLRNFVSSPKKITREEFRRNLKCTNPDCEEVFTLTVAEMEKDAAGAGGALIGTRGNAGFTCPKCGKRTAYKAIKCPQCKERFVPAVYYKQDARNRGLECPSCGWKPGGGRGK
ncbi:MAG: hypothetical protein QF662_02350 [Phycisphaerae bacterium]|jgi:DNA-directed RNA polymerase subunit RPC12/RpoP|nr:hypothetical protein [Phycisphaerae bacterium]